MKMFQDRAKSVFWLCLVKSLQPTVAGRRGFWEGDNPGTPAGGAAAAAAASSSSTTTSGGTATRTYARLGRLKLFCRDNDDGDVSYSVGGWVGGRRHLEWDDEDLAPDHGLTLPVSLKRMESRTIPSVVTATRYTSDTHSNDTDNHHDSTYGSSRRVFVTKRETTRLVSLQTKTRRRPSHVEQENDAAADTDRGNDVDEQVVVNPKISAGLTKPIIDEDVWGEVTGKEFEDPEIVNKLARTGLQLVTQLENDDVEAKQWIEWKAHKDTERVLQDQSVMSVLEEGEILVYIGTAKKDGVGSKLPIIQTKSVLPLSAKDMADLLMDSSRVKIYNKMSLGRKDVRVIDGKTKIVRNLTKPPVSNSPMVSTTLMHSRPLDESDQAFLLSSPAKSHSNKDDDDDSNTNDMKEGYLVVSRSVPLPIADDATAGSNDGHDENDGHQQHNIADLPRNDILLGVNLLQDLGPDKCLMTTVTHVYSPSLPVMLARGVGVNSAINFVKDIRNACEKR